MANDVSLPNLEDAMLEINQLIEKMEQGELSLEQSLLNFERGITLVKHCQKILNEAEQKVQILIQTHKQEGLASYSDNGQEHESKAASA